MSLFAIGLSHKTAPIELREEFVIRCGDVRQVCERLQQAKLSREVALLSTCNRVEIYCVPQAGSKIEDMHRLITRSCGLTSAQHQSKIYALTERHALSHLFRVASSLDSMILGEGQIVSQVKESFQKATEAKTIGPILHKVLERTLTVAKRIRTETEISKEAVSIGRAGVDLATQILGSLEGRSALLIGAGEHGRLVATNLCGGGLSELVIANRTFDRGAELAKQFGASAIPLTEARRYLERVDIVLTSVGGGGRLISREDLIAVRAKRRYRPLVLIDLSVPRVIDTSAHDLDGIFLFDIDDLSQIVTHGLKQRKSAAQLAEQIIKDETEVSWKMIQGELFNADIGQIYKQTELVRQSELQKFLKKMEHLPDADRKAIEQMTRALTQKILHNPIQTAKNCARESEYEQLQFLLNAMSISKSKDD